MDIVIQMYHNNPPTRDATEVGSATVWCRHVWDSSMISEAIEAALGDYQSMPVIEAEARAYNRLVVCTNPTLNLPEGYDPGYDVWHIMGTEEALLALANRWADEIVADAPTVSGDDTYYDYFPDYVSGLRQLCAQANLPEPYNRALDACFSGAYEDDPEAVDMFSGRL